jgi:hypothetical protein
MFNETKEKNTKFAKMGRLPVAAFAVLLTFSAFASSVSAASVAAPGLGTANGYGILAETATVTNQTHLQGNLGSGGITGTADVSGATEIASSAYTGAFTDFGSALNNANSQPANYKDGPANIGGKTLIPGVYDYSGAVQIGSDVILNGNGIYIFRIAGGFNTAANTRVILQGGAQACNVFWVADVATVGANSTLVGTLFSESAATLNDNSTVNGRVFAKTAVTANAANTNIIVPTACAPTTVNTPLGGTTGTTPTNGGTTGTGVVGGELPKTATPLYNVLFGAVTALALTGGIMFRINRRKTKEVL